MKNLLRILIVATFFGIIFYYTSFINDTSEPLEGPNSSNQAIPKTEVVKNQSLYPARPEKGLSTYIGEDSELLIEQYGLPNSVEKSSYDYEWWIYNSDENFIMFSIRKDKVNQVYTNNAVNDVSPYYLNEVLDDIYRMTIIETEISVEVDENIYIFSMNEEDMKSRILVAFDGIFAQLYIDSVTGQLSGIRYMDGETLVLHKAYEFQYIGEVIESATPSSFAQIEINKSLANQMNALVNEFRIKNGLRKMVLSPILAEIATNHSQEMYAENFLSHDSSESGDLEDRLKANELEYSKADENLAVSYYDPIEAVHGWLNSKDHRKVMLNEDFTTVGAGVYLNYYTQIFIEKEEVE